MESSGTRIGSQIAGFRIESVLGRGGMSVVYLAEQIRLGRKVALKVLTTGLLERDDQFRDRFLQESHVAASLDHPNIIPIYDAGEDAGCLYIAMRYVEGRDLAQILEHEGPLGLGRALFILNQVASALDTAHEHGLIHRDVKPANVLLVGKTDRVYLTDFGVAKPTTSAGLTRTGFFIGTPDYCAPEQIEGRDVDARTDVYALGAVFYSSLTGLAPYARDTEVAVLQAHLLEPPPRLRDQLPELPASLDRVLARAMSKSKEERYASCGDFLAAAEAAAHDRPMPVAVRGTPPPTTDAEEEAADPLHTVVAPHDVAAAQGATAPPSGGAPAPAPPPPTTVDGPAAPAAPPAPAAPSRGIRLSGRTLTIALIVAVVALAGVLAAVLATRGGSSSHTTGNGATSTFNVPLSSAAEVPKSLVSALSGTANVKITGSQVCWRFTLKGVDKPTAAHIHQGGPTVSGPVVVPLGGSFAPSGCTKSTAPVVAAILKDPTGYYVNVHSLKYPDGAVRGQLKTGAGSGSQLHFVGLQGIVPKGIFDRCKVQAKPAAGAIQTAVCARSNGTGQVYYPQQLELSTFGSTADVKRAYEAARRAANIKANFGRCDGTNWLGEGTWFHAPEAPGHPGKPGGTRFCYFDGNTAVIVWTHEKFEQANHVDLLGTARESSADHTDLFNWWRFWTHRIGKCLLVGCTASAR